MDWKVIVLSIFLLFGCVAKKKVVDVKKTEVEASQKVENSEDTKVNLSVQSDFKGFGISEFTQAASFLNWQFVGQNPSDEFRLKIDQTENGFEMIATGVGSASAETNSKFEVSRWQEEYQTKYDSVLTALSEYKETTESKFKQLEKSKEVDKKAIGVPAGVYIVAALLGLFWLLLAMFKRRLKLLLNTFKRRF
jgi:hypothetical protein